MLSPIVCFSEGRNRWGSEFLGESHAHLESPGHSFSPSPRQFIPGVLPNVAGCGMTLTPNRFVPV